MMLTAEEHTAAWHIKETIEDLCPELDNLSDFEYGTLAIVVEGDMERALEIATQMQDFRKEYDVLATLEDALRHKEDIYFKQPNGTRGTLAIDEDTDGTSILVNDMPKLDLRNYKSPRQIQKFFKGCYYQSVALCPDFRAVRAGYVALFECEGYQWKHNMMTVDYMKAVFRDAVGIFPMKTKKMMFFNSSMLVNTMVSMAKSVLPKHMIKKFHVGCRVPMGGSLDQIYDSPSTQVAEQRLEAKLESLLQR
eukprot:7396471-Ditylum_brightwellii.AAC.1